ncbi:MAG: hypothetical protein ABEI52_11815, partial [Halobacteriaceae archaeon]
MNSLSQFLTKIPDKIPSRVKPLFRPFTSLYDKSLKISQQLSSEQSVNTEFGPRIQIDYSQPIERNIAKGEYEEEKLEYFTNLIEEKNLFFADV